MTAAGSTGRFPPPFPAISGATHQPRLWFFCLRRLLFFGMFDRGTGWRIVAPARFSEKKHIRGTLCGSRHFFFVERKRETATRARARTRPNDSAKCADNIADAGAYLGRGLGKRHAGVARAQCLAD
nr:hypothetical protein [Pandoravirus massiliensis]